MSLEGKIAFVTGASRGIGQAIAKQLGASGALVVGTATTPAGAEKISAELVEQQVEGCGLCLDVTDQSTIEAAFIQIKQRYAAPTIVVNNAAITADNLLLRMKPDEWQSVIDTNLNAIYRITRVCLKDMIKARFGRVITIASVVASMGNPGQANYAAAKAGTIGFTKALAHEVCSRGVTANVVAPGLIETDMTRRLTDSQREALLASIPMARFGQPEEIAHAVNFLATPGAAYITGQVLHVNGGIYMA